MEGSSERKLWHDTLFSTPGLKVTNANLNLLCQLHFNPGDFQMKMIKGNLVCKLNPGVLPLPIKNAAHQISAENITGMTRCERRVYPAKNVTLVDINQIRNVGDTSPTLDTPENE